jgi:alkylation response protein AidB-like acyl-CoA dehydrogenase
MTAEGSLAALRADVRAFVDEARASGLFEPEVDGWFFGYSPDFSRAMAAKGWLGMTWPREYGGGGAPAEQRLVVIEELLAAGAPMNAHWVADRQTGPSILRYGSDEQRRTLLPRIAAGELFTALGMSEPGAGSDLAAIATRADRVAGGWSLTGTKIWMGNAHRAHLTVVLCRTSDSPNRAESMSQLIVDLASEGITVRPIVTLTGKPHFCEVHFDRVFVPDSMLLGTEGGGWPQVIAELAVERGGPERVMSTFVLLDRLVHVLDGVADPFVDARVGELATRLVALRALARSLLDESDDSVLAVRAAAFKEAGTRFEAEVTATVRQLADVAQVHDEVLAGLLDAAVTVGPAAGLRGGTTEIMHGIVARGLSGEPPAVRSPLAEAADGRSAALRTTTQLVGVMEAVQQLTVAHARSRVQFGRTIDTFQAVQRHLAELAGEVLLSAALLDAASSEASRGASSLLAEIARAHASASAGVVARLAHQVHGAVGFTQEHPLHELTERLLQWRNAGGSEHDRHPRIGAELRQQARGAGGLWPAITAVIDRG